MHMLLQPFSRNSHRYDDILHYVIFKTLAYLLTLSDNEFKPQMTDNISGPLLYDFHPVLASG